MIVDFISWITGLAQNIALLLSLTLLYSVIRPYLSRATAHARSLYAGGLFGFISIAGMHTPILIVPGVIADARVIPVLLAGPFGGPRAAAAAAVVASLYRVWLGGAGTIAGIGTILTAGALGVVIGRRWHGRERELGPVAFLLFGLALDAVLLAWSVALPSAGLARQVLGAAALPVGLFVPAGTLVLGMLLVNESRRSDERERLILADAAHARHLAEERTLRAKAEEANVLKEEFLATLSHELRTPLTAILGYARLLRTRPLDSAGAAHALAVIERNTRAQAQIVDDLLDLSAIMFGKLSVDRRPLDLASLVEDEIDAARPEAETHRLTLRCVVEQRPHVSGEVGRLQQVVRNLVANALKFTPAGGTVDVAVDAMGGVGRVVVRDTGRGIPPAFLPHVFDRFRQADSSMTRSHGGLGIGLAIVRHIVEVHDGVVTAESDGDGHGATFTVSLPLLVTSPSLKPSVERSRGAEETLPTLGGVRVLVVDDERETRELVATVLADCGAEVITAASLDEALVAIESVTPDVLVTDLAMPAGDGFALIRSIRSRSRNRGGAAPAVALTAFADRDTAARALAAGFAAHVAKPFEPADLVRVVARLAGRQVAA